MARAQAADRPLGSMDGLIAATAPRHDLALVILLLLPQSHCGITADTYSSRGLSERLPVNAWALLIYLVLGLLEFVVINRALREWLAMRGWIVALMAAVASYVPIVGGIVACAGAIAILEWSWWLAGGIFIGGTAALALTGGMAALWGQFSLF